MTTAINILDEMIKEYPLHSSQDALLDAKSRIQALGDGWITVSERLPNVYDTCNHELLQEYIDKIDWADENWTGQMLVEIQSKLIEPVEYEIGKIYEFLISDTKWVVGELYSYTYLNDDNDKNMREAYGIRKIQAPDEVSSAITLLEQEGYIITRKEYYDS